LLAACAAEDLAPGHQALPIVGGEPDATHTAVAALVVDGEQICTATAIAPRVVVTAAHCLPPHVPYPVTDIEVFFGQRLDEPGTRIAAIASAVHPGWRDDELGNDIGLLALEADAPVQPAELLVGGLPPAAGEEAVLVGFGTTTMGGTDNGQRRAATTAIQEVIGPSILLPPGGGLTCTGDSGGPLLVLRGEKWVVAGIHSRSDCERSEEHTSELQSRENLVCRLLLEKKKR